MNELRWIFHIEQIDEWTWRATHDDNYVIWGYGDNPYAAIADLENEMSDWWVNDNQQLSPLKGTDTE